MQATTGSGGWPLNVFLTPDLEPVFGGTYWPGPNATDGPSMKGQIGFVEVLEKIVKVYDYKDMHQALHDLHEGTAIKPVIRWS